MSTTLPVCPKTGSTSPSLTVHLCLHTALLREIGNAPSLFPALHRLEQKGWLTAEWGRSETNRKAKYYELTSAGRRHTDEEVRNWKRVSVAIELALRDVGEV